MLASTIRLLSRSKLVGVNPFASTQPINREQNIRLSCKPISLTLTTIHVQVKMLYGPLTVSMSARVNPHGRLLRSDCTKLLPVTTSLKQRSRWKPLRVTLTNLFFRATSFCEVDKVCSCIPILLTRTVRK